MAKTSSTNTLADKLNKKLSEGIVTFSYRRSDGIIRYAVGTTISDLMPADKAPKTSGSHDTATNQRYYDFVSKDWRTVKKDEIIRIATTVVR